MRETCPHCWDWQAEIVVVAVDDDGRECWAEVPCTKCGRFWGDAPAAPLPDADGDEAA